MLIESKFERKIGIDIDDDVYHFEKDADGRFVCDVKNEDHVNIFLGISDYCECETSEEYVDAEKIVINVTPQKKKRGRPAKAK